MFEDAIDVRPVFLIVDDCVENLKLLHAALAGLGDVLFATDGATALRLATERQPDIVMLDIEMPGMDGWFVCRALKANPRTTNCRVIFVTAHTSPEHELESLISGGIDFLTKPLNIAVVRARAEVQMTLKRQADDLARARRDLLDVVHNLPVFVGYWGAEGCNRFSNDPAGEWFGIGPKQMLGRSLRDVVGDDLFADLEPSLDRLSSGRAVIFELSIRRPDRPVRYAQGTLVPQPDAGLVGGFVLLLADLTDRKLAEMALHDEKERFRIMLNSIGDAVIATDLEGRVTDMNPIAEDMTGWSSKKAIGRAIEAVMPLREGTSGAALINPVRYALKEKRIVGMALNATLSGFAGRDYLVEDSAAPIRDRDGIMTGAIIVFHDVSEARAMAIKMSHLAQHDALTDLPNRLMLQDRLGLAVETAANNGTRVAMLLMDVDHFNSVNEGLGHAAGDELLQQVATRLRELLPANNTVTRQGADEFAVLLPDLDSLQRVDDVARSLVARVEAPFWVGGEEVHATVSVGISIFPDDARDAEALMRHADTALHWSKRDGRRRCRFFSSDIEEVAAARYATRRLLRDALDLGRFEVAYQTKVDVQNGRIDGVEALLRLRDANGQAVPPAEFIPFSEECGLIVPIGRFVLEQVCRQARLWLDRGISIPVSVNVSAVQFAQPDFAATIQMILAETRMPPDLLELELTESVFVRAVEQSVVNLHELKRMGIRISLDDFGTGYCSFSYLKRIPIDALKIDQSFVRDMLHDDADRAIVEAIVQIGSSLGLKVIAEGVETREHKQALLGLGCHIMQGYHFSRPLSGEDITPLLSDSPMKERLSVAASPQPH